MPDRPLVQIVNVSGGKDSTACYLLALERRDRTGHSFRAVFADTGHEHPETYAYIRSLPARTGGPVVETVRADFTRRMAVKRRTIRERWPAQGVPREIVTRALLACRPTGVPFLDLCILKGRFPSLGARFCTEDLKVRPIEEHVVVPTLQHSGRLALWTGERRDESEARAHLPRLQRFRWHDPSGTVIRYRPLVDWSAEDVFALHRRHGVEPNPLYRAGMGRVGCMPCILCRKSELRAIALRYPGEIARVRAWETLVARASKRGQATFFAADKTPTGRRMAEAGATQDYPGIEQVVGWSLRDRAGYSLPADTIDADRGQCASIYGLCE